MGIIACTALESNVSVPILRKEVKYQEMTDLGRIQIMFFHQYKSEQMVQFESLSKIMKRKSA
jgi:hypothetical protein